MLLIMMIKVRIVHLDFYRAKPGFNDPQRSNFTGKALKTIKAITHNKPYKQ